MMLSCTSPPGATFVLTLTLEFAQLGTLVSGILQHHSLIYFIQILSSLLTVTVGGLSTSFMRVRQTQVQQVC